MGYPYSKNQRQKSVGTPVPSPDTEKVKTGGRIGSPTPAGRMSGGLSVDNNSAAQSHRGDIGSKAAGHMSPNRDGGNWSPRVAKARAKAATPRRRTGLK